LRGRTLLKGFLDFVLPPRCCVCGVRLHAEVDGDSPFFCESCVGEVRDDAAKRCLRCSAPLGPADAHEDGCPACQSTPLRFKRSYAAGTYKGLMRELILGLKFHRRSDLAEPLAGLLFQGFPSGEDRLPVDVVVPVPTVRARMVWRGYSAVRLLSQHLGRMMGAPWRDVLSLTRRVDEQRGLSRAARFGNVQGAFRVTRRDATVGRKVLLVDDVMTTGATASECALTLRRAGAMKVEVAVIAKTHLEGSN